MLKLTAYAGFVSSAINVKLVIIRDIISRVRFIVSHYNKKSTMGALQHQHRSNTFHDVFVNKAQT